jgi:raffinose/stachyose/melibiose transport system permease protein
MKNKERNIINSVVVQLSLMTLSLAVLIPLWMLFINSLKSPGEASALGLGMPTSWKFENYVNVFIEGKLLRGFLNSSLITFSSVLLVLFTGAVASYTLSRRKNRATSVIYGVFLLGLIAPPQIVPTVKVLQILGIYGSFPGIILFYSGIFMPFVILLMTGFIKSVPRELDESALVDGCSPLGIFFKIVMPLLKPIFATTFVLVFMFVWNDFNYPLYLLQNSKTWTMPMSVFNFTSAYGNLWNYVFADLIMASLPIIIVYTFAQQFLIKGLTAGAVKG